MLFVGIARCTPLDDYVSKEDPHYSYFDTNETVKGMPFGGVAYMLNVTSQKWLDTSKAAGPCGALWTHQVAVIVPKEVEITNVSMAYLTGGCNEGPPKTPSKDDEDIIVADALAHNIKAVTIVVFQLPNCHLIYPADPLQKPREEDAMIAFACYQFLEDPTHNPEWLPRLPMAKGAMQSMRAAQDWLEKTYWPRVQQRQLAAAPVGIAPTPPIKL